MDLKVEAQFRGNFHENSWSYRAFGSAAGDILTSSPDITVTNFNQTYSIAAGTTYHQVGYYEPILHPGPSSPIVMPTEDNTVVVSEHGKCMPFSENSPVSDILFLSLLRANSAAKSLFYRPSVFLPGGQHSHTHMHSYWIP